MTIAGHVFFVQDAKVAFFPVILDNQPPTSGFVPWVGSTVAISYHWIGNVTLSGSRLGATSVVQPDGSFSFQEPAPVGHLHSPAAASVAHPMQPTGINPMPINGFHPPPLSEGEVDSVSLIISNGVSVFRSGVIEIATAKSKPLNIWIFTDQVPPSDGISAGLVSQQISGAGLPGNTIITAGGPNGLNFSGSEGQVDINFNIAVAPSTSADLTDLLDLSINGWNIHVGWPTSWVESADDVLGKITSGIAGAGTSINKAVINKIKLILETQENLPDGTVDAFLNNDVSVTLLGVGFPTSHSWGIGATTDATVVLQANAAIGFPRKF